MSALIKLRTKAKTRILLNLYSLPDPENIYRLDPERIEYCGEDVKHWEIQRDVNRRRVRGGVWDLSVCKFTDTEYYKAIKSRITSNEDWIKTVFYQEALEIIESEGFFWGCHCREELQQHLDNIDHLIQLIKNDSQVFNSIHSDQINELHVPGKKGTVEQFITCNIGRNGDYLLQGGADLLAITQVLGTSNIAVKVQTRHQGWQDLREFLLLMAKGSGGAASRGGLLYQPALHPDLRDIPAAHDCEERFLAMQYHLPDKPGNLLDLGSNLGYFCHKFENLGFSCYAVEILHEVAWAARKISEAEKKSFRVINGNIFDVFEQNNLKDIHFDIVLALNIFHHFIKTENGHNKLENILRKLPVELMFFEAHRHGEPQMHGSFRDYTDLEFVDFLLKNSVLNCAEFVYQDHDGRKLYKLYK
jgi:2-polyprenyl-3-methyl-5-hydroxy-6-metoxy-1,4-benzoquinol methylase